MEGENSTRIGGGHKDGVFLIPSGVIKTPRSMFFLPLCIFVVLLVAIGMTNLYSASINTGLFFVQLKHLGVALVVFALFAWVIPFNYIQTYGYVIFAAVCMLLVMVLVMGSAAGGAQRWLGVGPFRIQPSEFAKLALPIAVSRYFFKNRQDQPYALKELWPVAAMTFLAFLLIFRQPDLGTAGFCLLVVAAQLAFIRLDMRTLSIVGIVGLTIAVVGWTVFLHDYQKLRILNLVNPNLDPYGSGYNSMQSLVAVGSGNLFGKGFLHGTQTQLQFLPARHTDFVFSVFAEEHGFWACILVFLLFAALAYIALAIARHAKDNFSALLAVGIAALIFIEFTINVSMVLGLFPVVGMPLPFFSFGGTALLTNFAGIGLLVAIDRDSMGAKEVSVSVPTVS